MLLFASGVVFSPTFVQGQHGYDGQRHLRSAGDTISSAEATAADPRLSLWQRELCAAAAGAETLKASCALPAQARHGFRTEAAHHSGAGCEGVPLRGQPARSCRSRLASTRNHLSGKEHLHPFRGAGGGEGISVAATPEAL